jgi:hypothetical protein
MDYASPQHSLVTPASATQPVLRDHPAAGASGVSVLTLVGIVAGAVAVLALVALLF